MINYEQKEEYIRVKWKRTEIGRIYKEGGEWHYRPRGCEGKLRSEPFPNLPSLKRHLEHDDTQSV
jgi:hypothetical protein